MTLIEHVTRLANEIEEISDLDMDSYELGWYHATRSLVQKWHRELTLEDKTTAEIKKR